MNSYAKPFRFHSAFGLAVMVCFAVLPTFSQGQTTVGQGLQEFKAAKDVVRQIEEGEPIDLTEVTIVGDLDLSEVGSVHRPIRCQGCSFRGAIRAANVTFNSMIDFGDSQFQGPVDFQGAIFESALLFRTTGQQPTKFFDKAVFSYADFRDTAGFDSVHFEKNSDFVAAQFRGDASFANANFNQVSDFDYARFDGDVTFTGQTGGDCEGEIIKGIFKDRVTFRRTVFKGHADFRERCFEGEAVLERAKFGYRADFSQALFMGTESNFNGASFAGRADFSQALFEEKSNFSSVSFDEGSSFIAAIFRGEASFVDTGSGGSLKFDFAEFHGHANFFRLSSTGALSMSQVTFFKEVNMDELSASDLVMDIDDVSRIKSPDIQKIILPMVISSAQRRGDLALANKAEYKWRSLMNEELDGPISHFDSVVLQDFFGYFVKPWHPLQTFLAFILVGWVARTLRYFVGICLTHPSTNPLRTDLSPSWRYGRTTKSRNIPKSLATLLLKSPATFLYVNTLRAEKLAAGILGALATTITVAFKIKPDIETVSADTALQYFVTGLRWTEFLVYKILTIAFLIGLGNSNPTLHKLIDAVL